MNNNSKRITELKKAIDLLPLGNITYKTIRGKSRMYLQWSEDGIRKSKYVKAGDEAIVLEQLAKRQSLADELNSLIALEANNGAVKDASVADHGIIRETVSIMKYETNVVLGEKLDRMSEQADQFDRRDCFKKLRTYISNKPAGKVCVLYGLRRTGKTVMVLQAISDLPTDEAAYIKIISSDNMAMLNRDLMQLTREGVKYIFIDEITLMSDFIDSASLLSDIYAASGVHIVLSGTDSLGFALSADDELYDRAYMIHTTFIPFREYSRLIGYKNVDEYIRYGGTFKVAETNFEDEELLDENASFRDDETTRRYIDTAIARNIQHSLSGYQSGGHFRHLIDLYEAGELTNMINRVIEDMNHRFLLSVINKDFVSHDLGSARELDRKKAAASGKEAVLDNINEENVLGTLKAILEIRDSDELTVKLTYDHITEIKQYLEILDLIVNVPSETIGSSNRIERILFSQPGMRYCQAQALVYSLMKDDSFIKYPATTRKAITENILREVRGRMLEEIVLLETVKSLPRGQRAFKLQLPIGEYDMVIHDENKLTCKLFEIKHSDKTDARQYRYMIDDEKLASVENQYGEIIDRTVLYNGSDTVINGIKYQNVVHYLEGLPSN